MNGPTRVWGFSLGDPQGVAQTVRLAGPLSLLPPETFEYTPAPSWSALARLSSPPDIAVFQRNFFPFRQAKKVAALVRARGGKVVLDLDDLLTEVPDDHPSASYYRKYAADILEAIRGADLVTVTNERLKARYARENPKVTVLPNLVDERIWNGTSSSRPADGIVRLAYCGAPQHARDLELARPALEELLRKHAGRVSLSLIGCAPSWLTALPGVTASEVIQNYAEYARAVRSGGFDAILAPLKDEPFNAGKSNIKFIEFSACGIPGAYSAVGPYADSIEDGKTGILVPNTARAWSEALERLIADTELRTRIGAAARAAVAKDYSMNAKARLWSDLYSELAPARRGGSSLSPFVSYGPYLAYALTKRRY